MKVERIMTMPVHTVRGETPVKEAARLMVREEVGGLPVVDEGRRVIGMVTESDFLKKEVARGLPRGWRPGGTSEGGSASRVVSEVMSTEVVSVDPEASVVEAARLMAERGLRRLPVVDPDGYLVGMVSRGDVLRTFVRDDEEIEAEIRRELVRDVLLLEGEGLELSVADGVVRLAGELPTRTDAHILNELVQRVEGVVGIDSSVVWTVDDTPSRRPARQEGSAR